VRRQKLFKQFIDEASKLYADAPRVHERAKVSALVSVYALINRKCAPNSSFGTKRNKVRLTLPAERIGPAKLRCSAASHNGVRVDLRVIDRGVSSDQIGSHQQTAAYREVFLADPC
jgi:hypothetical protein